ncbi:MAG: ABC transporter ATP-binding protein [Chloroflexi bacterium]|nr:ABC transporter ATP-binding protein [Chloroflexota bacterium]MCY4246011.1 ABC transporter ATP-binding protein [Chloroflexota bacterium]
MTKRAIVSIRDLHKNYGEGARSRRIMAGVNFDIYAGEFFVLLGTSGSGKSTLLNLLSAIDSPTRGQIRIGNTDITALNDLQQTRFRRDHIGIVFQFFNLIPTLTALENITLPQELGGAARGKIETRARELLAEVGLAERADDYPDNLSGGEQQRVAICRALLHEPQIVLADEPTGNLDEDTGRAVIQLLLRLTRDAGKTLIMATHSAEIVPLAHRVCRIADGQLHIETIAPPASANRSAVKISNNALE